MAEIQRQIVAGPNEEQFKNHLFGRPSEPLLFKMLIENARAGELPTKDARIYVNGIDREDGSGKKFMFRGKMLSDPWNTYTVRGYYDVQHMSGFVKIQSKPD